MELSGIYIYPIKSLGGIQLAESQLTDRGLQYDRRFMLTTKEGVFLTQRKFKEMALFRTAIERNSLRVWREDQVANQMTLPLCPTEFIKEIETEVWGSPCKGMVLSAAINQWFTAALGTECQLIYMPDSSLRPMKKKYSEAGELVSFADGSPILLIGQAALDDLNQRLDQPVLMNRFRPNLVFSGGNPFEEDTWSAVSIGDQVFKVTHRCIRCNVPNINQETGKIEKEPNRTLATFRRFEKAIYFGVNIAWQGQADIHPIGLKVGQNLTIQKG